MTEMVDGLVTVHVTGLVTSVVTKLVAELVTELVGLQLHWWMDFLLNQRLDWCLVA